MLDWLIFAAFILGLARLSGRRVALPRTLTAALLVPFRRSDASDSDSESDESADGEGWERGGTDGRAVMGGGSGSSVQIVDDEPPPGLIERLTSRLERWADGVPEVVHETPAPGPTDREVQRAALVDHLTRERARTSPALPATRIVEAAADQADVPWGTVSRATVWRVWRELP